MNTFTWHAQGDPDVAVDEEGRIWVTWIGTEYRCRDFPGPFPCNAPDQFAQLFGPDGVPVGGEFLVHPPSDVHPHEQRSSEYGGRVAPVPGGGWLQTWKYANQWMMARLFDAVGDPLSEPFPTNEGERWYPCFIDEYGCGENCFENEFHSLQLAMDREGRWVTAWGSGGNNCYFRRHAGLASVGVDVAINWSWNGCYWRPEYQPRVAFGLDGELVVVTSRTSDIYRLLIPGFFEYVYDTLVLRRYAWDGEVLSAPIALDEVFGVRGLVCIDHSYEVAVGPDGSVVVVWIGYRDDPDVCRAMGAMGYCGSMVWAQRFTRELEPLGDPERVYEAKPLPFGWADNVENVAIAMDSRGRYVVVWLHNDYLVEGQRFAADGTRIGHQLRLGGCGAILCGPPQPRVGMNDSGRCVVAYHTSDWYGWCDVVARVFDFDAPDFVRGDVTGEGRVDVTDAIAMARYLFLRWDPPSHPDAADTNDDGEQDISDVIYLLLHLYVERPPALPPPYPDWGFDTTPDDLGG